MFEDFKPSLLFAGKVWSLPKSALLGQAKGIKTQGWNVFAKHKHSSLFFLFICDEEKVYNNVVQVQIFNFSFFVTEKQVK